MYITETRKLVPHVSYIIKLLPWTFLLYAGLQHCSNTYNYVLNCNSIQSWGCKASLPVPRKFEVINGIWFSVSTPSLKQTFPNKSLLLPLNIGLCEILTIDFSLWIAIPPFLCLNHGLHHRRSSMSTMLHSQSFGFGHLDNLSAFPSELRRLNSTENAYSDVVFN